VEVKQSEACSAVPPGLRELAGGNNWTHRHMPCKPASREPITMHTGAVHAAMIQAIRASGAIVRVEARDFDRIVRSAGDALVIRARPSAFSRKYHYMTSYRGFIFYTRTREQLQFASSVEVIEAKTVYAPA
jgi:hypothetical protein